MVEHQLVTTATAVSEVAQDFEGPTIESETQEIIETR